MQRKHMASISERCRSSLRYYFGGPANGAWGEQDSFYGDYGDMPEWLDDGLIDCSCACVRTKSSIFGTLMRTELHSTMVSEFMASLRLR